MWKSTLFLLLLFLSLACAFQKVFVLVVHDTSYLSAIRGKGQSAVYSYGNLSSVVSILQRKKVEWEVFVDDIVDCSLDPSSFANYSYLISQDDVSSLSKPCTQIRDSTDLQKISAHGHLSPFSIHFPSLDNASSASWLRQALYLGLSSTKFLESVITVIITPGENESANMLLLGNDALFPPDFTKNDSWWNSLQEFFVGLTWVPPSPPPPVWFDRIFILVLSNQPIDTVLTNHHMRFFAEQGTLLMDFNAIDNPSQLNYVAMLAGDTLDVTDFDVYNLSSSNVVDLLEEKGVSWKAYVENYPEPCYIGKQEGLYVREHNPFISFDSVRENSTRCAKIVHADQLFEDIAQNDLPKYMFYTPNINNNGHDTGLSYSSKWLDLFLPPLLLNDNFMQKTLVVVTYDEGIKPYNRVFTLFLGDMIPFGNVDNTTYTHYSLLRLVEDQFALGSLGRNDVDAPIISSGNFYPGDIPKMKSSMMMYVGIAVGGVLIVCALFASFYYLFVIRRNHRSRTKPLVSLQRSQEQSHEEEEEDDYEEDSEEERVDVKSDLSISLSM